MKKSYRIYNKFSEEPLVLEADGMTVLRGGTLCFWNLADDPMIPGSYFKQAFRYSATALWSEVLVDPTA